MSTQSFPAAADASGHSYCAPCVERGRFNRATHFPDDTPMCNSCFTGEPTSGMPNLQGLAAVVHGVAVQFRRHAANAMRLSSELRLLQETLASGSYVSAEALGQCAQLAAKHSRTTVAAMMARTRVPTVVSARRVMIWLAQQRGFGFSEIGRFLKLHHTTVMHHAAKIDKEIKLNPDLASKLLALVKEAEGK